MTCSVDGCARAVKARGMCAGHHRVWLRKNPSVRYSPAPPIERFRQNLQDPDHKGCIVWKGAPNAAGYGRLSVDGRRVLAHRFAYELANGSIPDGLVIDHKCRNRLCVNPDHLRACTNRENCASGIRGELRPGKSSRFRGAWRRPRYRRWESAIQVDGNIQHLGLFETEEQAALAYAAAVSQLCPAEGEALRRVVERAS